MTKGGALDVSGGADSKAGRSFCANSPRAEAG